MHRALQIRKAARADAETWLALRTALWPSADHPSEIAAFFEGRNTEPNEVMLAFDNGAAVAPLELSIRYDVAGAIGVRTGYIEGLYVVPAARNYRMNRLLIRAALAWAVSQGCLAFASDRAGRPVLFPKAKPKQQT